ncbi:MAG: hypothetical protein ACK559_21655, partial [bacterium]
DRHHQADRVPGGNNNGSSHRGLRRRHLRVGLLARRLPGHPGQPVFGTHQCAHQLHNDVHRRDRHRVRERQEPGGRPRAQGNDGAVRKSGAEDTHQEHRRVLPPNGADPG